jgi:hypothetical protein
MRMQLVYIRFSCPPFPQEGLKERLHPAWLVLQERNPELVRSTTLSKQKQACFLSMTEVTSPSRLLGTNTIWRKVSRKEK